MKLTIGNLAKQAEATVETIRYYQRIGLLDEPGKPLSGYRHYPSHAIARIRLIKRAQQAGFTLKELSKFRLTLFYRTGFRLLSEVYLKALILRIHHALFECRLSDI